MSTRVENRRANTLFLLLRPRGKAQSWFGQECLYAGMKLPLH